MSKLKKFTLITTSVIGLYQIKSLYNYGKFYNKVMQLRFNGGVKNTDELYELDKLVKNIGIYPFSLVSSLYHGPNKLEFNINKYYLPIIKISTDVNFMKAVESWYIKFGPKENYNLKPKADNC